MAALVAYSDDDDDDDDDDDAPAVLGVQPTALTALADDDDDDDDDDSAPSKQQRVDAPPTIQPSGLALPDFEDALSQAETPAFLSAPPSADWFEHVEFDSRPPPPPPEEKAPAPEMPPPRAPPKPTAAQTAAAARDRARGADRGDSKKKDKESLKDRTKLKRERDQSASFLGGAWKTEEEMHMRDNFDS